MDLEVYDETNTLVQIVMVLKFQQLLSTSIPALQYENLEDYLHNGLWKEKCPKSLSVATNDVLNVEANDIVRFMAKEAIYHASNNELDDFMNYFGGKK